MTYIVWSGKLLVSLWPSCVADADSVFLPCGFFLSIFFPRLISAESRMHVWNMLHAARWNTGCKTTTQQPFYGPLSGTTRVSQYQKKHSPTHHPDHHPIFISCFHLPRSIASSLFKLHAWQSFCTTSFYVLFGLPLGLEPSTSYSVHFFTKSVFCFRCICPYHRNLFCCSINIILSIPGQLLTWNSIFYLNITYPSDHSHFCSLKCHLIFRPHRSTTYMDAVYC